MAFQSRDLLLILRLLTTGAGMGEAYDCYGCLYACELVPGTPRQDMTYCKSHVIHLVSSVEIA